MEARRCVKECQKIGNLIPLFSENLHIIWYLKTGEKQDIVFFLCSVSRKAVGKNTPVDRIVITMTEPNLP